MEKVINLEFNSSGVLINHDEGEIRQGDKGVVINAIFDGKNNANYIARFNLTRNDGTQSVNNIMSADATNSRKYTKQLDSEWYFAKDGEATLTVFLVDGSGNQLANGQVTIAVQKTDYIGDPTITPDEYQELLEEIAKKLNIVDGIIKTSSISDLGNLEQYNVGQVFFVKNNLDTKLWQLNPSYNLDLLFDFKYIDAGRVESINLVLNRNAINNNLWIQLIDKNNLAIATASVTLHPASTTNAGLMSAEDKATLNNIPNVYETKNAAQNSHDSLHHEIVAETTRATGVEAQKENLSNKKTVVNDSTATDANYLSAKAVRDFVNSSITSGASFFRGNFDYLENVPSGKTGTTLLGVEWQTTDPDAPHFVSNNDYALVNDDETHNDEAWRYKYVLGTGWLAEYKVNEAPFTQAQLDAINSGITTAKVGSYDEHISDTDIHVTTEDKTKWDDVVNKQNKVIYSETEPENPEENDVWVNPTMELAEDVVIGDGLRLTEAHGVKTLSSKAIKVYQHSIRFRKNETNYKIILINNSAFANRTISAITDALINQIKFNLFFDESSIAGTLSLRPIISFEMIQTGAHSSAWHFYTMNAGEMTDTEIDPIGITQIFDNVVEL